MELRAPRGTLQFGHQGLGPQGAPSGPKWPQGALGPFGGPWGRMGPHGAPWGWPWLAYGQARLATTAHGCPAYGWVVESYLAAIVLTVFVFVFVLFLFFLLPVFGRLASLICPGHGSGRFKPKSSRFRTPAR